jgi:hypothetical protein
VQLTVLLNNKVKKVIDGDARQTTCVALTFKTVEEGSSGKHGAPEGMSNLYRQWATLVIMGWLVGCLHKNNEWYT